LLFLMTELAKLVWYLAISPEKRQQIKTPISGKAKCGTFAVVTWLVALLTLIPYQPLSILAFVLGYIAGGGFGGWNLFDLVFL